MEELFNMKPELWDSWISGMYESPFSYDMIEESVERACDFFHIEQPAEILQGHTTAVNLGDTNTFGDERLFFNLAQLENMGITEQDGLDLVMTHEGTHIMLQDLDTGFNQFQEELCCDYMAGVRAGLNGMDVSQLENSLIDLPQGLEHPVGTLRVDAIEQGLAFAHNYMATHTLPPTFNECLEDFNGDYMRDVAELNQLEKEVYACECTMEHYHRLMECEPDNSIHELHYNESKMQYYHALSEYESKLSLFGQNYTGNTETIVQGNSVSFKAAKSDTSSNYKKEWEQYHLKKADEAYEKEEIWTKEAQKALERGDDSAAKKCFDRAKSYHNTAKDHADRAASYR